MKYTINDQEVSKEEWDNSTKDGIHKVYRFNDKLEQEIPYINGQPRPDLLLPKNRLAYLAIFGQKQPKG